MLLFENIPSAYRALVPEYKSRTWKPLVFKIEKWDFVYGEDVREINKKRADNRSLSYLDPVEITRVYEKLYLQQKSEVSIRFGYEKKGKGYHGERGDFCLVGGAIVNKHLSLFYRSLEMIGGFGYDLTLINRLGADLGINWKSVTFFATHANVFALKRNSNEKLYPKLRKILEI